MDYEEDIVKNFIELGDNFNNCDLEKVIDRLKMKIIMFEDWGECLNDIIDFYIQYGIGEFGEYRVFVWENEDNNIYLRGV